MRCGLCFILFFLLTTYVLLPASAFAIVNPTSFSNNKFGIHVATPDGTDLKQAAELVNSNKGDWGYITLVIQETDRNTGKWQGVFDELYNKHLIPIIRLATQPEGGHWRVPTKEEAGQWAQFLNSLTWVTKNRYVILFNEPNHGTEWGGSVDPENYGRVALAFSKALKEKSDDFYLMFAGLDQIAPNALPFHLSEEEFVRRMLFAYSIEELSEISINISGLSSHSYPNPGFTGSVDGYGKGSVRGYEWEKEVYRLNGLAKDLPIFITETGWNQSSMGEEQNAFNMKTVFENIWVKDEEVVAVTPFILNYQGDPFLGFSWRKKDSTEYYQIYKTVQGMHKKQGVPELETKIEFLSTLPTKLIVNSQYTFTFRVKNIGRSTWDGNKGYSFTLSSADNFKYHFFTLTNVAPQEERDIVLYLKTPDLLGKRTLYLSMVNNRALASKVYEWNIVELPVIQMMVKYSFLLGGKSDKKADFQLELYDSAEHLVYKKEHITGENGNIFIQDVKNVIIGQKYRVVLLKPGFLPRQTYITLKNHGSIAQLKYMLPLDWNKDGKFDLKDFFWFL